MILVPKYVEEGRAAALLGTHMNSLEVPMGFVFCPYMPGTAEHSNFVAGVKQVHFDDTWGPAK